MPEMRGKILAACCFVACATAGSMLYGLGGWGQRAFEMLVRGLVTFVVLCFLGVVVKLTAEGILDWGKVLAGFVPDLGQYCPRPAVGFAELSARASRFRGFGAT
jgi:Mn2+/Fe2+ NRAMP family transporter